MVKQVRSRLKSTNQQDALLLIIFIGVALFMRFYQLNSAPAGMNGDEFFNAIDALSLGPGNWQVFFQGNNGREALFLYIMAIPLQLFGQELWAIRLPAVFFGTGSILLAYLIGRRLFNRRIGLLAAALITVSLWPMMQSRLGYRAVTLTFFTALTIFLYSLAFQYQRILLRIAAGVALGLSLYTYIPARIFPLVIIGWFVWLVFTRRGYIQKQWSSILLSLFVALIIFAPFGYYMAQNPEIVNQRISSLEGTNDLNKALQGDPAALIQSASYVLFMFILSGDTSFRYHLADRPVFDPVFGVFFYLGLAVTLWLAIRRSGEPDRRASYGLLLLWSGAMLAPSIILGPNTSFLRSAGAIVPVYLMAAIGVDSLFSWLMRRWPGRQMIWRYGLVGLLFLGLVLTLADTWRAFFDTWINHEKVRSSYHSDLAEIGRFLDQDQVPKGTSVFVAYDYVGETTPQSFEYYSDNSANWFDHSSHLSWRPSDSESWVLIAESRPLNPELEAKLSEIAAKETVNYQNGDPAFTFYRFEPADLRWEPQEIFEVGFLDNPTLIGFDLPEAIYRGEMIHLTLHFRIPPNLAALANRLTFAQVFLEDAEGNIWEQSDQLLGYPEAGWQEDDRFVQIMPLSIPPGMPPGPMYLRFGLSDWQGNPISMLESKTERAGPFLLRSRPVQDIQLESDVPLFDDTLALQEQAFSSLLVPGLPIDISLDWLVVNQPNNDYRVKLELIEPDSEEAFLSQTFELWPAIYPPSEWQQGEQITTFHRLDIPLDIPTEVDPQLRIQVISQGNNKSLPLTQGSNLLSSMTLQLREHLFDIPDISQPLKAIFGDQIRLLGYDLENTTGRPNGELNLTLYWQAIETPSKGYTVFNHLVGNDGQIQSQFDSPPVSDAWLTSTWLPGEIVVDRRAIPIRPSAPIGNYQLAIGLYDAGDGERLPVTIGGISQSNEQLILADISIEP